MLTEFGRSFPDAAALAAALAGHIRGYPIRVEKRAEGWRLIVPHRPPLEWRAPKRNLRFGNRAPNTRFHESTETAAFDFILDRWDPGVFYDLGASVGYYVFMAAARADRHPEIHAFDLRPPLLDEIREMVARHALPNVHLHLSAIGREDQGEKDVWIVNTRLFEEEPPPGEWRKDIFARIKYRLQGKADKHRPQKHRVGFESLDGFATRHAPPGLVKIDVDGFEAEVIPGALRCLAAHRPVLLLELHRPAYFTRFGTTREKVVQPLFDLGYSCLFLTDRNNADRNEVLEVGPGHPLLARSGSDLLMFV